MEEVSKGVKRVVRHVLDIQDGENVVIAYNERQSEIAGKFFEELPYATMLCYPETGRHGKEPPEDMVDEIVNCDAFIFANQYSLSHTEVRRRASANGARGVSMPGISDELFVSVNCDYEKLKDDTIKMQRAIDGVDMVRIEFDGGGEIEFSIKGREFECLYGDYREKGKWGNIPEGEVCGAPIIESANGIIRYNHWGGVNNGGVIEVKNGIAVGFEGNAKLFGERLKGAGEKAFKIAEFGIGTNRSAVVCGNVLQDEKVFGTVHIAFGNNESYDGGDNDAAIHEDVIIDNPSVWFDGRKIIDRGEWLI